MNDFIDNTLDRALGRVSAIQPRRARRFEPPAPAAFTLLEEERVWEAGSPEPNGPSHEARPNPAPEPVADRQPLPGERMGHLSHPDADEIISRPPVGEPAVRPHALQGDTLPPSVSEQATGPSLIQNGATRPWQPSAALADAPHAPHEHATPALDAPRPGKDAPTTDARAQKTVATAPQPTDERHVAPRGAPRAELPALDRQERTGTATTFERRDARFGAPRADLPALDRQGRGPTDATLLSASDQQAGITHRQRAADVPQRPSAPGRSLAERARQGKPHFADSLFVEPHAARQPTTDEFSRPATAPKVEQLNTLPPVAASVPRAALPRPVLERGPSVGEAPAVPERGPSEGGRSDDLRVSTPAPLLARHGSSTDERGLPEPTSRRRADLQSANQPAAPSIQVTIGRIEVRADAARPQPQAKARSADAPMNLDAYLRQRNGGRR